MEMTLRLPSTYVDIEKDEMEYVDGGGMFTFVVSKSVLNACIGLGASVGVAMALSAAGITGGLSTFVLPGLAGLIGAVISNGLLKQNWYTFNIYVSGIFNDLALNAMSGWDRKFTLAM